MTETRIVLEAAQILRRRRVGRPADEGCERPAPARARSHACTPWCSYGCCLRSFYSRPSHSSCTDGSTRGLRRRPTPHLPYPSGAARCPVIAADLSQRAGRAWIRIPAKLQDAGVGTVAARKPRRLRIDLMRAVSGLLLPAVAYLARRKTRWDYSKCHKRRRLARRARFCPHTRPSGLAL